MAEVGWQKKIIFKRGCETEAKTLIQSLDNIGALLGSYKVDGQWTAVVRFPSELDFFIWLNATA